MRAAMGIVVVLSLSWTSNAAASTLTTVPGEVVVRYAPGARSDVVRGVVGVRASRPTAGPRTEVLRLAGGADVGEAVRQLDARRDVVWAEPNQWYWLSSLPTDPRFAEQWALRNVGQLVDGAAGLSGADIDALGAWSVTMGSPRVTVAVVDSGVRAEHPDLAGQLLAGVDVTAEADGPRDNHGHGTALAGIIAARADHAGIVERIRGAVTRVCAPVARSTVKIPSSLGTPTSPGSMTWRGPPRANAIAPAGSARASRLLTPRASPRSSPRRSQTTAAPSSPATAMTSAKRLRPTGLSVMSCVNVQQDRARRAMRRRSPGLAAHHDGLGHVTLNAALDQN